MKVIFIFVDGIGIGNRDTGSNPIYAASTKVLAGLIDKAKFHTDASLGIAGLPQSATGQTAIFTGVNAAAVLNRHMSGQPTETLRKIIHEVNLFRRLKELGLGVANANVYRDAYLNNMLTLEDRRNRPSVTSVMCMAEQLPFRTVRDFISNNGVYHDITGEKLIESGYEVELVSPEKAAHNLFEISRQSDFTLYEHFITDIAGHIAELPQAVEVVERLDRFLGELIRLMDFEEEVLIITSDHGNLEDISVHTHTMNKVPFIVLGKKAEKVEFEVLSLVDIMPYVLKLFREEKEVNE